MKDFKKNHRFGEGHTTGGFGGGASRGGGFRASQRGRDASRPVEMHRATCANCGKACEVPFAPNGTRPVYCKGCFSGQRDQPQGGYRRDAPHTFPRRDEAPIYAQKPQNTDRNFDELKVQVSSIQRKLDSMAGVLEGLVRTLSEREPKETKTLGSVVQKITKRAASKKK